MRGTSTIVSASTSTELERLCSRLPGMLPELPRLGDPLLVSRPWQVRYSWRVRSSGERVAPTYSLHTTRQDAWLTIFNLYKGHRFGTRDDVWLAIAEYRCPPVGDPDVSGFGTAWQLCRLPN